MNDFFQALFQIKYLATSNDKDPPWMTSNLKNKLNWKNGIYKDGLKNSKTNMVSLFSATCQKYQY